MITLSDAFVASLIELLKSFDDQDPCQNDHHGYCQAHGWLQSGQCHVAQLREIVKFFEKPEPVAPVKPPIGLKPRKIHEQERGLEIVWAMQRYIDAGVEIPGEWLDELRQIHGRITGKQEKT